MKRQSLVSKHFTLKRHQRTSSHSVRADSVIRDSAGKVIFERKGIEVPEGWSQLAIDILASKYMRRVGVPKTGHESSFRQVIGRITRALEREALRTRVLSRDQAKVFKSELTAILTCQIAAFNSPVWFNLGLSDSYRIRGSGGNFIYDEKKRRAVEIKDNLRHPQTSACFIQSLEDDLMAIFELVKSEARLFKYGSGTGTNFSKIRGREEKLSGGGSSSGLLSFLEVLDRGAGATKSGGTTRRAAKMVCLDADHPEILDFIRWKKLEEEKAQALIREGYSADFNGDAYRTVSGQNSNNSVRLEDSFMQALVQGKNWSLRARTTGEVLSELPAQKIWREIAEAAWACADPGLQFDSTINAWHTCPQSGPIRASNPCSEFMFLDDTACNLASINLMKFLDSDGGFDFEGFSHVVRVVILAQELLVGLSSYPTAKIAERSHQFRPLGLGFANLGALLMVKGLPYDSDAGRALAAGITAFMTAEAYGMSADLAAKRKPFSGYSKNKASMKRVLERHAQAAQMIPYELIPSEFRERVLSAWESALQKGVAQGYRNAQVTVLAPTGTIGLLMDCDTTGIEPDFSLVKFKKLAGGGSFKMVNRSVPLALEALGYSEVQIADMMEYLLGKLKWSEAEGALSCTRLRSLGFLDSDLERLQARLAGAFGLGSVFTREAMGDALLRRLGVQEEVFCAPGYHYLQTLRIPAEDLERLEAQICGHMTLEGAPHLKPEHLAVFDCANRCGPRGTRFIAPMGHIRMMAAVQPFLSGAISKTVNLPHETSVQEIEMIHLMAWKLGLKSIAVYRDGCKASQPLSAGVGDVANIRNAEARAGVRQKLPSKRTGITIQSKVGGRTLYLRTGEYADGRLGEIFLDLDPASRSASEPDSRALLQCFAIAISLGLQYGVPLQEYFDHFAFTTFEPAGSVEGDPHLKRATSLIDYVFRTLGIEYLDLSHLAHVAPVSSESGATAKRERTSEASRGGAHSSGGANASTLFDAIDAQLSALSGDAPACDACGHSTVRNGSCFRCLHCGNSMGCS